MSDRRTRPAPIHLGVASIIATLAGCGASPAAPCGGCEPPLACLAFEVQVDGLIFAESSGARACSAACTADDACAALGPTAYCSTYDVCVVPCGVDTECAEGELCFGGACAAEIDDVRPDASPFEEARSPLALGARVGWQAWVDRCASDMVATSEPAGVLEVDAVTTSSGASEGCFVFAELRAIALGSADLVVSSGDVELRRDEVRVDLPARLSIVRVSIFGAGPPGRVDLQRVDGPGSLAVVARDVLGSRLAVGSGATWSIDDPRVGALSAPADGSIWLVGGLTSLSRAEGGTTTLRVRVGGVSRAVPVEL